MTTTQDSNQFQQNLKNYPNFQNVFNNFTNPNLQKPEPTCSEISPRSNTLSAQSNATSTFSSSSQTIGRLISENKLLRLEISKLSKDFKCMSEQLHSTKLENQDLHDDKIKIKSDLNKMMGENKNLQSENNQISKTSENKILNLQTTNTKLSNKLTKLNDTKYEIQKSVKSLRDSLTESQEKIDKLISELSQTKTENASILGQLAHYKQQTSLNNQQIKNLQSNLQIKTDEVEELTLSKSNANQQIENLTNQIDHYKSEFQESINSNQKIQYQMKISTDRIQELENLLEITKQNNTKLSNEIYASRNETKNACGRENLLKHDIEDFRNKISNLKLSFGEEKLNLLSDLSIKLRKGENEFNAVKRAFSFHQNNNKKLNLFKREIYEKIKELPESTKKVDGAYKILAQTKLELSRLRNLKKDQLNNIKILEKHKLSLNSTVKKQEEIIEKLENGNNNLTNKIQKLVQEKQNFENLKMINFENVEKLKSENYSLQEKFENLKTDNIHKTQQFKDQEILIQEMQQNFGVYLHGLWHKILTCDLINLEKIDEKIDKSDESDKNGILKIQIQVGLGDLIGKMSILDEKLIEIGRKNQDLIKLNNSTRKIHGQNLNKIESELKKQENNFNDSQKLMESKYCKFVEELQNKDKGQNLKIESLEKINKGLVCDVKNLKSTAQSYQNKLLNNSNLINNFNKSLSISLGTVCGLISKNSALCNERSLLIKEYKNSKLAHSYLLKLNKAFQNKNFEICQKVNEHGLSLAKIHPILKFRKLVIVVMAANRMFKIQVENVKSNNKLSTICPINSSKIMQVFSLSRCRGGDTKQESVNKEITKLVENVFNFQSDNKIMKIGMVDNLTMHPIDCNVLNSLIRSYMKLLAQKQEPKQKSHMSTFKSRYLHHRLSTGLFNIIKSKKLDKPVKQAVSLTFAASGVQRSILSMTEQLHSSEIERKSLRKTELQLREQIIRQRHQLELNGSIGKDNFKEFEINELKSDMQILKVDYSELTKVIHQCENELKHSTNLSNGDSISKVNFQGSNSEVSTWLKAQKLAIDRINLLENQISNYRKKLEVNVNNLNFVEY